jgi:hypothetical protein
MGHHGAISGTASGALKRCEGLLRGLVTNAMDLETEATLLCHSDHLRESRGAVEQDPSIGITGLPLGPGLSLILRHCDGEDRLFGTDRLSDLPLVRSGRGGKGGAGTSLMAAVSAPRDPSVKILTRSTIR